MFEGAKWITGLDTENKDGSFLLRKQFIIGKPVTAAVLFVVGLGYGEYTLNGEVITDEVLSTPFTRFDKRVLYSKYDVSALLKSGANVIGVFLGNGWYNDISSTWDFQKATWRDVPKLLAYISIEYTDGTLDTIITDSSWQSTEGPCIYNHLRQGEIYDARLEHLNWDTEVFDSSAWAYAKIARSPGGILEPANIPPIRVIRCLSAVQKTETRLYDFGENISGWARIRLSGIAGQTVTMRYGERLNFDGTLNQHINVFTQREGMPLHHENRYIMRGGGKEEYAPKFCYHGFRYVEVENAPEEFEITAEVVHTDLDRIGSFECSDILLNKIHEASVRSTLTNFHSIPTDCPHREQNGWTGDALISCEQSLMNFDMIKVYKKWLNDFKDVQRPSGQLPGIIPTSNWGYNWGSGPAWDSALIMIPWYVYQNTGDKSLISQMWDNMKLYMEYMDSMAVDYTVDYGLGDWCPPPNAVICPSVVSDTAYYYVNVKTMAKFAEIMNEDGSEYKKLAKNVRSAYRNRFLNNIKLEKSQTFLACGIYQGLYNDDEIPQKAKLLAELVINNDYHIDCGILGTKYIFTALSENGYADVLHKMITNPTMPSYAFWINEGMTTLCESWEMKNSCNHHMFSEVDNWFYKYVAGIRIDMGNVIIRPCFLKDLSFVKACHKDIFVEWDKEKIEISSPKSFVLELPDKSLILKAGHHIVRR